MLLIVAATFMALDEISLPCAESAILVDLATTADDVSFVIVVVVVVMMDVVAINEKSESTALIFKEQASEKPKMQAQPNNWRNFNLGRDDKAGETAGRNEDLVVVLSADTIILPLFYNEKDKTHTVTVRGV